MELFSINNLENFMMWIAVFINLPAVAVYLIIWNYLQRPAKRTMNPEWEIEYEKLNDQIGGI